MSEVTSKRSMLQKEKEPDRAYHAFLLWSIQDSAHRTNRELSRLLDCSEGSIRYWKHKFNWAARQRMSVNSEYVALELYRERVTYQKEESLRLQMTKGLEAILGNAPASLRAFVRRQAVGVSTIIDALDTKEISLELQTGASSKRSDREATLQQKIREKYLSEDSVGRQIKLIDATMGLIARKISDGSLKVSVSDIPALIKARALLTGVPTQHVHVTSEHEVTIKESPRVRNLRQLGAGEADLLGAMQEDVRELSVILSAVRASNVQAKEDKRRVIELDSEGNVIKGESDE